MSDHDLVLVAVKREWVPERLWRIAKHWMPLAELLAEPIRCAWGCREAATALVQDIPGTDLSWPQGVPTCDIHMARTRTATRHAWNNHGSPTYCVWCGAIWSREIAMEPCPAQPGEHVPHRGNHEGYACGFSGPHCWACNEPWPCRAIRGAAAQEARLDQSVFVAGFVTRWLVAG